MIANGANLRTLNIGFSTAFQGGFTGVEPSWNKAAMKVTSTTKTTEYGWLGKLPNIREWLGDRVVNSLSVDGYRIRNRKFEGTYGVLKEDIEDDNIGIYAPIFQELGRSAAAFPDQLVWPLLPAGMITPCYDGQYFFDTDHPVLAKDGSTTLVSNHGGGASTPWYLLDMSRVVKPLIFQERSPFKFVAMDAPTDEVVFSRDEYRYGVDGRCNAGYGLWQLAYVSQQPLNEDNYAAARAAMSGMLGDYGRPLGIRPQLLVVPPNLESAGRKVLLAQQGQYGATNVWQNTATLHVEPWLAAA